MLADEIANYANDYSSSGRFAIVLHSEWGSGKTFFCENVLALRLKKDGLTLLRVSLFGVSDIDDLCERILATLSHLPKGLLKEGSSSIVSEVNSLLGKVGLRVDIKAQTVLSMLDPWIRKNHSWCSTMSRGVVFPMQTVTADRRVTCSGWLTTWSRIMDGTLCSYVTSHMSSITTAARR